MNETPIPTRSADYQLPVSVEGQDGERITDLRCKIYLPQHLREKPKLFLFPTAEQSRTALGGHSSFWKFSLYGEKGDLDDHFLRIKAENVFSLLMESHGWAPNQTEELWTAEALDLSIQQGLPNNPQPTEARFWITPCKSLTPASTRKTSWTGEVTIDTLQEKKYTLANGLDVDFQNHYKFSKNGDGDIVSSSHLVAVTNLWGEPNGATKISERLFREIDDFLLIAGFVRRHSSKCYGLRLFDSIGMTDFYRGDISIPPKPENSNQENLIDRPKQDEFIRTVYSRFAADSSIDLIRDAIYSVLPNTTSTIQSDFTRMFSGLEAVILAFRRQHNLEYIFAEDDQDEWKTFTENRLKPLLREQTLFAGDEQKERRQLLYNNLQGLKRIALGYAYSKFCEFYNLDMSCLWQVNTTGDGLWSLTDIRNKLVHGDGIGEHKLQPLAFASRHLQWTLERVLIAYLGWDISKSNVCDAFLVPFEHAKRDLDPARKQISD